MMHQNNLYYALVVRFVGFLVAVVMVAGSVIGIFCASFDDCFFSYFLNVSALPTEGLKVIENGFDKVLSFSFAEVVTML